MASACERLPAGSAREFILQVGLFAASSGQLRTREHVEDVPEKRGVRRSMPGMPLEEIASRRDERNGRISASVSAMSSARSTSHPQLSASRRACPARGRRMFAGRRPQRAGASADARDHRQPGHRHRPSARLRDALKAIDPTQAAELRERCWRALLDAASEQRSHQAASEPAARFVELLSAAVAAGRAHLANEAGDRR